MNGGVVLGGGRSRHQIVGGRLFSLKKIRLDIRGEAFTFGAISSVGIDGKKESNLNLCIWPGDQKCVSRDDKKQ